MSTDTVGRIKGYITADAIFEYIKKRWDLTAESNVTRSNISSIKKNNLGLSGQRTQRRF